MLTARNVYKKFDKTEVLKGVSLTVEEGQTVALIGQSGSGKSTFLRCLNQLEKVDAGEITVNGVNMCEMKNGKCVYAGGKSLREITLSMGMVAMARIFSPQTWAAATTVPRELMEDWSTTLPIEQTEYSRPRGRPMMQIFFMRAPETAVSFSPESLTR